MSALNWEDDTSGNWEDDLTLDNNVHLPVIAVNVGTLMTRV